ncbi:MAG: exosortase C-terminal domain/associated protein EpsI [Candidatus Omnitrophota bacterium]
MPINKNTIGFSAIVILLAVTSFFSLNLYLREKVAHDKLNISAFPQNVLGWQGRDLLITEKEYSILETRNLISREYKNAAGERLFLFIIYSETNRAVFHPPEVCLIGSGIEIVDKKTEKVKVNKQTFAVNKLYIEKKNSLKELVLYCYRAGGMYTDNFFLQQAYLALHQIFGKQIPGATIRVSMSLKGSEEATLPSVEEFLSETIIILNKLS